MDSRSGHRGFGAGICGRHLPKITLQTGTRVRSNNNKKEVKQADFPAEAPESKSHEYEAGHAECAVHDLSSRCSKESSLIQISESCDHTKNDGGTNEGKKHRAHGVFVVPRERQQALCPESEIFSYSRKSLFSSDLPMTLRSNLFEAFSAES